MSVTRRSFLNLLTANGLGLGLASQGAVAAPLKKGGPDARFLMVFLRGGYDALSLLVPAHSDFYRQVRPGIGVPVGGDAGARLLNSDWALNPCVESALRPLWQGQQLAFVPFAGTHDVSRSHFETQDSMEFGQAIGHARDLSSGFLNRLAGQLGATQAMSFTDQLPIIFSGPTEVANQSLKANPAKALNSQLQSAVSGMYAHHALGQRVAEGFQVREQLMQDYAAEMDAASRKAANASAFEAQARRMARLMRDRYGLGFIDVGGWDTHVNQGPINGYLAKQLGELSQGMTAFADELGDEAWRRTVVVVLSEFGRTVRENGNRGTDHGHGSVHWVLGGALRGGRVVGEQQTLEARTLFQDRDVPVLNDFRAVLGGLFQRQFGLSAKAMDIVFPGARPLDLGLI